jgi:hypothetical protein
VNGHRVFEALQEFGAPLTGLSESDFASGGFYQMGRPPAAQDRKPTKAAGGGRSKKMEEDQ